MAFFTNVFIWVIAGATILCILIRPRDIAEAWWACAGAFLLLGTTLISIPEAGSAILKGTDVYLFLAGMMMLSELAREKGVFDWIAEIAATHAAGSPRRLFLLIYLSGTIVTAFLSNDATAVVLTPAVLTIVRRLKVEPSPHLLACAFIANAASFILPISNPANLVIYWRQIPPLLTWLQIFLVPSIAAVVVTFLILRLVSSRYLKGEIVAALEQTKLTREGRLALGGLIGAAIVLMTASALGWPLGVPTFIAAMLVLIIAAIYDKAVPIKVVRGVSWSIIPLVGGLFVIVEALHPTGLLDLASGVLDTANRQGHLWGNMIAAFSVAALSNGVNNLPVALFTGAAIVASPAHASLANAVLIGVDLGPNLSVTGSLATILWLIALRRENVKITAWEFFRIGLVVMPTALFASVLVSL